MKIVHVEDFIHPDAGYQVNLLARLQVKDGHDVSIVTGELDKIPTFLTSFFGRENIEARDERFFLESGAKIHRVPLFGFYSGRAIFYPRIFRVIDELRPDVVFVHGEDTLTGMRFLTKVRKLNYPIIFDCHSTDMGCFNKMKGAFRLFYRRFFTPIILKNNIPLIRVVDVDFVEKHFGIPLAHTDLLSFGTDTDWFRPNSDSRAKFIKEHKISSDAHIVLYAGKLDVYKGGKLLAAAVEKKIAGKDGREVVFVVIGNIDGEYGQQVEAIFAKSENRIIRLPTQRYLDLAYFYQSADIALYPRQCSMSFFEAQSCALPILFENNEVNCERASYGGALTFREGDVEDFRKKLLQMIDMPPTEFTKMKESARHLVVETYDFVPISRRFTEVLSRARRQWEAAKAVRGRLA